MLIYCFGIIKKIRNIRKSMRIYCFRINFICVTVIISAGRYTIAVPHRSPSFAIVSHRIPLFQSYPSYFLHSILSLLSTYSLSSFLLFYPLGTSAFACPTLACPPLATAHSTTLHSRHHHSFFFSRYPHTLLPSHPFFTTLLCITIFLDPGA